MEFDTASSALKYMVNITGWNIVAQSDVKPRAFCYPYKHYHWANESHGHSPTTFHLKPPPVYELSLNENAQDIWLTGGLTGGHKYMYVVECCLVISQIKVLIVSTINCVWLMSKLRLTFLRLFLSMT